MNKHLSLVLELAVFGALLLYVGACSEEIKILPCSADIECPRGTTCDPSGICVAAGTCNVDADCGDGAACGADGWCWQIVACDEDAQCAEGGLCIDERCVTSSSCSMDWDWMRWS